MFCWLFVYISVLCSENVSFASKHLQTLWIWIIFRLLFAVLVVSGHWTALSGRIRIQVSDWCWTCLLLWSGQTPVRVELCENDTDERRDGEKARSDSTAMFYLRAWSQDRRLVRFIVLLLCECVCRGGTGSEFRRVPDPGTRPLLPGQIRAGSGYLICDM